MKEVGHALRDQLGVAENYVANSHSPFRGQMRENTILLAKDLQLVRDNFTPQACTRILGMLDEAQQSFLVQIGTEQISLRKSELYLGYLLFAREVLNRYMMVKLLQTELEAAAANCCSRGGKCQTGRSSARRRPQVAVSKVSFLMRLKRSGWSLRRFALGNWVQLLKIPQAHSSNGKCRGHLYFFLPFQS